MPGIVLDAKCGEPDKSSSPLDLHSTERQHETNKIQYTVFLKCQYHISHKDMIKLVYKKYITQSIKLCVCVISERILLRLL